jgi:hypothetical protein
MTEMNKLKLKILIDAEQWEGDIQLSNWEYTETVDYPYINNSEANKMTLDLRKAIQDAIDSVVQTFAAVKAEATYGENPNGLIKSR